MPPRPNIARRSLLALALGLGLPAGVRAQARPAPPFSIGAITDFQYADEDDDGQRMYRRSPTKLKAAVARFNTMDLEYVVHLGDFIDKDWSSFDAVQPIIDSLRHPWRFVLGNHDFAVADAMKPRVAQRLGMPGRYYSFETHGWVFLALDGNDLSEYGWPAGSPELAQSQAAHRTLYPGAPDWDGGIGPVQLRWMDKVLAAADAAGKKAVLYCHFPCWPLNPHDLWNAPEVIALIERHPSAKAWINGHNHDGNYGVRNGIHYVNLKAMLDTAETAYAVIDFHPEHIRINGVGRQPSMTLPLR